MKSTLSRVGQVASDLVKQTQTLPDDFGDEYEAYSSDPVFKDQVKVIKDKIQHLFARIDPILNSDELDERSVVEYARKLREKSQLMKDEEKGISSLPEKVAASSAAGSITSQTVSDGSSTKVAGKSLRPQDLFKDSVIDNSNAPFKPILTEKPHAVVPLDSYWKSDAPSHLEDHLNSIRGEPDAYPNPYEEEIRLALAEEVPDWMRKEEQQFPLRVKSQAAASKKGKIRRNNEPSSLEQIPVSFISDDETFEEFKSHVCQPGEHQVIAIDLEHHSMHSYQGFTCLMQVSTTSRDFLVDTLVLRHRMKELLVMFADPSVVKILHGSDHDVEWLQRDFGLYVVQMFDTGQAARVLSYESASLAYLLSKFVNVRADKSLQLADWRVRPLKSDMMHYAREDTHYLLGIFDQLRMELIKAGQDKLQQVLERSARIASKVYEKPTLAPDSHLDMIIRYNQRDFGEAKLAALWRLMEYRDKLARELDESWEYLIPNRALLRIVKEKPVALQALLREMETTNCSQEARERIEEILAILQIKSKKRKIEIQAPEFHTHQTSPEPSPPIREGDQNMSLSLNEQRMTFQLALAQGSAPKMTSKSSSQLEVVTTSGLFGDRKLDSFYSVPAKISKFNMNLASEAAKEMEARMQMVEQEGRVDEILNEVFAQEDQAKEEAQVKTVPKSLDEQAESQGKKRRKKTEQSPRVSRSIVKTKEEEEQDVPQVDQSGMFRFTKEMATNAGAVESATKQTQSGDDLRSAGTRKKPRQEDPGKEGKPKQNPYLLLPSRRLASSSTSYVPK